jgi:hypothetical protein
MMEAPYADWTSRWVDLDWSFGIARMLAHSSRQLSSRVRT